LQVIEIEQVSKKKQLIPMVSVLKKRLLAKSLFPINKYSPKYGIQIRNTAIGQFLHPFGPINRIFDIHKKPFT
jgi:hypothetical protein